MLKQKKKGLREGLGNGFKKLGICYFLCGR